MGKTRKHIQLFETKKKKRDNWLKNQLVLKNNQWYEDNWDRKYN